MVQTGSDVALAFGLTIASGFATCIGGAIVYAPQIRQLSTAKVISASLSLAAGVMVYVAFIEIFPEAEEHFHDAGISHGASHAWAAVTFFGGFASVYLLDILLHKISPRGPHIDDEMLAELEQGPVGTDQSDIEVGVKQSGQNSPTSTPNSSQEYTANANGATVEISAQVKDPDATARRLHSMGVLTAVSIALHNFPEGLATFIATLKDPSVGAILAIAIAIHNIPEGIAVAMPVYYSTGSKWKAFMWTLWSALAEPFGAFVAWLFFADSFDDIAYAIMFGIVGGMMVCIGLKELMPMAHRFDREDKYSTNFLIIGMVIMALSIIMFEATE
jgi:ZIP family zinc transporter